jgi:DNA topoisomerase-1
MKTLIITEKPKVSQRIAYALPGSATRKRRGRVSYFLVEQNGDEVYVASAAGHLYSLKAGKDGFGFPEFDISWQPLYEIDKGKYYTKGYIDTLHSLSKDADRFIIATDWDIEGELLGFNALRFSCGVNEAERMRFSTLVSHDLRRAFEELDLVDHGLADAGEARHIMDWYWGINISRALMHSTRMKGGRFSISAGRVQTPALSILVKREREIGEFVPEKFYEIFASLKVGESKVKAEHRKGRFSDKTKAELVLEASRVSEGTVLRVEKKQTQRYPPVPFDLGELQSEAYRVFRFNPKRTQELAQSLYESGLISYPRTSSQKYPPAIGFRRLIEALSKMKGFETAAALLEKEKLYPRQGKKDDPAHPAIYPTGVAPKKLGTQEEKLFKLIVHRFLATFGESALLETTTVDVTLGPEPYFFAATMIQSRGWLDFYPYVKIDEKALPVIQSGDLLPVLAVEMSEGETRPPPRYNPASLIRELEAKGLGTKATRAEIVDTLYRRRYIKEIPMKVTGAGMAVIGALEQYVPEIIDEELTRRFEESVEKIRVKETSKEAVLAEAKKELVKIIDEFKEKESEIGAVLFEAFTVTKRKQEFVGECSDCGGELRIIKNPKTGKQFIGCSGYPKCRKSFPLPQKVPVKPTDNACNACGLPMIGLSFGRKKILSCIDPNCTSKQKRKQK